MRASTSTAHLISLARRPRRLALRDGVRQYTSSSSSSLTSPSPKICSVPFKLSPEDALGSMHMNGLIATAKMSNLIYAMLLKLFGPGISSIAREFGMGSTVKVKEMKAALYPIWRIDSILEGEVEGAQGGGGGEAWVGVQDGYVPGNPFAPLSYLSFIPPLPRDLPPYNPDKDLKQLGDGFDIAAVPFTTSPIGLMKKLRQTVGRRSTSNGIRVDETKWSETLLAAYPVMFPIYLALIEFESPTEGMFKNRSFTIVLDAHDEDVSKCRASWPPPPELYASEKIAKNYYVNPNPFLPDLKLVLPSSLSTYSAPDTPPLTSKSLAQKFQGWMSPPMSSATFIRPSPLYDVDEGVDWDDVRIQSWSGEEKEQNEEFVRRGVEMQKAVAGLQSLSSISSKLPDGTDPRGTVISFGNGTQSKTPGIAIKPMSEIKDQMKSDIEVMRKGWEESRPTWLKDWEKAKAFGKEKGQ